MEKIFDYLQPKSRFNKIKVKIKYYKGGIDYFTGQTVGRGYYLLLKPFKKEKGAEVMLFSGDVINAGGMIFLLEAKRYSKKKEKELYLLLEPYFEEVVNNFIKNEGDVDFEIFMKLRDIIKSRTIK